MRVSAGEIGEEVINVLKQLNEEGAVEVEEYMDIWHDSIDQTSDDNAIPSSNVVT